MAGASWVQQEVLEKNPGRDVQVYAVWFNVLPTDSRGRWDPDLLDDPRVTEFWDPAGTAGDYFAEHRDAMGLDFSGGVVVWDVSLLFGPDASWEAYPMPLEHFGYTVWAERRDLSRQLERLWADA